MRISTALASSSLYPVKAPKRTQTPWRERDALPLRTAGEIAGTSPASLYKANAEGRLKLICRMGRTLVDTKSFIAFLEQAEEWTSKRQRVG